MNRWQWCEICGAQIVSTKKHRHCQNCRRALAEISYKQKVLVTTHFNRDGIALCGARTPDWRLVTKEVTCAKCILVQRIQRRKESQSNGNPQPHPCAVVQQQSGGVLVNRDGRRIVVAPRNEGRRVNRLPSAGTSQNSTVENVSSEASERVGVA